MFIESPSCPSPKIKKNGNTYYEEQKHKCKNCGRQFIINKKKFSKDKNKDLIKLALKNGFLYESWGKYLESALLWFKVSYNLLAKTLFIKNTHNANQGLKATRRK